MVNDLQVIKELQDSGIELFEVEELSYLGNGGYVLENDKVIQLMILSIKEIPESLSKLTNLKRLDLNRTIVLL